MLKRVAIMLALTFAALTPAALAAPDRQPPYWASIAASSAMMRTGPGRNYPATWLYVRPDLPIRVVETYPNWRKVQDPDGTTGWMLVGLLSDTRTAIVRGEAAQPMHDAPDDASRVAFRAEPGVVGRVSRCASGWCRMAVGDRSGYIRTTHLWGLDENEVL